MTSASSLFSWSVSEGPSSWSVNDVRICGVNRVVGALSDGLHSNVVALDMNSGSTTADWKQIPSTVVSLGYLPSNPVLIAFDKEGGIWQLDPRSSGTKPASFPALQDRNTGDCALAGAVSSDGHSLAVAVTISNGVTAKKKKKKPQDRGDQESDSDEESVEPFTHSVQLWDVRNMSSPLHSYSRSHSDDIQALSFGVDQPWLLMSGGADGLVNMFDSRKPDEDDAILSTNQMDSSISRVGFLTSSRAYALTDDNCYAVMKLDAPDDVNVLFRKKYPNEGSFIVDVVDCDRNDCLYLVDSTGEGKCAVLVVPNDGSKIEVVREMEGHSDLIRCVDYDVDQRVVVSGADDGRIVGYELSPPVVDVQVARGKSRSRHKNKPYDR